MVILLAFLIVRRPDWGMIAVAIWTLLSLLVHVVQLVQALDSPLTRTAGPVLARLRREG